MQVFCRFTSAAECVGVKCYILKNGKIKKNTPSVLPVFLIIDQKPCLVIGGGKVACRKVKWLLDSGACVNVITIEACSGILKLKHLYSENLSLLIADFNEIKVDMNDYALVISACGDMKVNRHIHLKASEVGVPVNVADVPELCTFYVPATIRSGSVCLAVGTGGQCPGLAKYLRQSLEEWVPDCLGYFAEALSDTRLWLRSLPDVSVEQRHEILTSIINDEIFNKCRELSTEEIKLHMRKIIKNTLDSGKAEL